MSSEIGIENGDWVSEYNVKAMGFEVQDTSLRQALIVLRNRINTFFDEVIKND